MKLYVKSNSSDSFDPVDKFLNELKTTSILDMDISLI